MEVPLDTPQQFGKAPAMKPLSIIGLILAALLGAGPARCLGEDSFTNSVGMKMVRIEPGSFLMGADDGCWDERPVHRVTIRHPTVTTTARPWQSAATAICWRSGIRAGPSRGGNWGLSPAAFPTARKHGSRQPLSGMLRIATIMPRHCGSTKLASSITSMDWELRPPGAVWQPFCERQTIMAPAGPKPG